MQKPSIPKGTRDFGPQQVARRNHIFGVVRRVFEKFGYAPLETPTMENLSVLTGKYGDEGDQLLFKILNSGDFAKDVSADDLAAGSKKILPKVAEKGLRYDLTVPFARYVVMNRGQLTLPFKRYQIQPVWRADRPQRGRYREFVQCDADVVGTTSLLCEAEIVLMIDEVLSTLGLTDFTIKINHRGVLSGIYQALGGEGTESDLFVAIDKLDKIGRDGVTRELLERGFSQGAIDKVFQYLEVGGSFDEKLSTLRTAFGADGVLADATAGPARGLADLEQVQGYLQDFGFENFARLDFDVTLARGLSYYTGCIFEVKVNNVQMGSISGGGRYDNLTGAFGLPGLSGVGFSFGVDRIYDVLEELKLFPEDVAAAPLCLVANFDHEGRATVLPLLKALRDAGLSAELYPEVSKLKKQFEYADKRGIRYLLLAGPDERAAGQVKLRDMRSGTEQMLPLAEAATEVQKLA
ncbi:histidine--tRNA ligase [Hymenobacter busanensis]|uniref:Histidine--tRNA ligase n=1 Tax=Hymenobacter busanensis TaxID=2607656 RepID=A0A7L4ZU72_9BACT|nr:histidine--tRNA ligase [Hymenobacter busanensis]KAA9339537.1 histidine--tRNA ligase [Hymenobacter busanensis]QHJ06708.1 histidine--tRNA ligase [Hymenobacter busanensis]